MKTYKYILFFALTVTFMVSTNAQNITVEYRSKSTLDTLQISHYPEELQRVLRDGVKGEVYELRIAKNKSLYKLKNTIEKKEDRRESTTSDDQGNSKTTITIVNKQSESVFKDQEEKVMISSITYAGSEYLIEEPIQNIQWNIINENKTIGDFKCNKATAMINGYETEAWFTSEISLNNGPSSYSGLPGLILEIRFRKIVISAEKINYNQNNQSLSPPENGEKITREEYIAMKKKRMTPSSTSETITNGNTTTTKKATTTIIKN